MMNRSEKLSAKQFLRIAKKAFGEALEPYGFTSQESKNCTFYKKINEEIHHLIRPVCSSRLPQYNIWVFPHSPKIETNFVALFPDKLSPPTDCWCNLHSTEGIGPSQDCFWCRTEEGFLRNFSEKVQPNLVKHALPYLERIKTVQDLVPLIRSRYYQMQASKLNLKEEQSD